MFVKGDAMMLALRALLFLFKFQSLGGPTKSRVSSEWKSGEVKPFRREEKNVVQGRITFDFRAISSVVNKFYKTQKRNSKQLCFLERLKTKERCLLIFLQARQLNDKHKANPKFMSNDDMPERFAECFQKKTTTRRFRSARRRISNRLPSTASKIDDVEQQMPLKSICSSITQAGSASTQKQLISFHLGWWWFRDEPGCGGDNSNR